MSAPRPAQRVMDLAIAACLAPAAVVMLAVLAGGVLLTSGSPAFFVQVRIGRGGRPFRLVKLRTLYADRQGAGARVSPSEDSVTTIGKFLRRTRLDELPQLWNVLRGDMSLVGPRPELPHIVVGYGPAERPVLDYRPGLTDPATLAHLDEKRQLSGADDPELTYAEEILPTKISMSLAYARHASVLTDLTVLLRTVTSLARIWWKD